MFSASARPLCLCADFARSLYLPALSFFLCFLPHRPKLVFVLVFYRDWKLSFITNDCPRYIFPREILRPAEVCPAEVCPAEVCPAEVCPVEVCPVEVCPVEVCLGEVCPVEVWPDEFCLSVSFPVVRCHVAA